MKISRKKHGKYVAPVKYKLVRFDLEWSQFKSIEKFHQAKFQFSLHIKLKPCVRCLPSLCEMKNKMAVCITEIYYHIGAIVRPQTSTSQPQMWPIKNRNLISIIIVLCSSFDHFAACGCVFPLVTSTFTVLSRSIFIEIDKISLHLLNWRVYYRYTKKKTHEHTHIHLHHNGDENVQYIIWWHTTMK